MVKLQEQIPDVMLLDTGASGFMVKKMPRP
jgi:hypothetical protein